MLLLQLQEDRRKMVRTGEGGVGLRLNGEPEMAAPCHFGIPCFESRFCGHVALGGLMGSHCGRMHAYAPHATCKRFKFWHYKVIE